MATREQIEAAWNVYDSVSVTPERPIEYKIGLMIDAAMRARAPIAAGSGPDIPRSWVYQAVEELVNLVKAVEKVAAAVVGVDVQLEELTKMLREREERQGQRSPS